ncbi:MAG: hypothetical protein KDB36_05100, partial [Acidimicrobiales bacterium]|nr:hypothetical protein [Acidimicrobiales bacterium]
MSRATRQALAAVSLLALLAAVVVTVVAVPGDVLRLVGAVVLLLAAVVAAWFGMVRRGVKRLVGLVVGVACLAGVIVLGLTADAHGVALVVVVVLAAASAAAARAALRQDLATVTPEGTLVGAATRPVLIMNLRSGGGKAERFHLEDECRARGIDPVVLRPGDDLRQLAADAVARGADVIGMAGGDGSQALVASVAAEHDVAHVCIPAGTRNHFALDLGLDRDDVVGALDAYAGGYERRIDLATVNGRVFVNNVSLGVYAEIVQSPDYRDAKRQTTTTMLPDLLGPTAEPFDVHFDGPDGRRHDGAQVIQVSNNRYVLTSLTGFGTRARLDEGVLGIAAA